MPDFIIKYDDLIDKLDIHKIPMVKTKRMLIVRPKLPGDGYTTLFSFPASELVKSYAIGKGWTVTDLAINDATREKVEDALDHKIIDFVVHYDHGGNYTMYGQKNNASVPAIDTANATRLKGRAASTVSCDTAVGLGPALVADGARGYLGYAEPHWVHTGFIDKFTEAANAANLALLEGKTYQEAYNIGYQKYTQKYNELLAAGQTVPASLMLGDRDCFTLLGNTSAVATGKHPIFILKTVEPALVQPVIPVP